MDNIKFNEWKEQIEKDFKATIELIKKNTEKIEQLKDMIRLVRVAKDRFSSDEKIRVEYWIKYGQPLELEKATLINENSELDSKRKELNCLLDTLVQFSPQ